jgi:hypothetical protein
LRGCAFFFDGYLPTGQLFAPPQHRPHTAIDIDSARDFYRLLG